MRIGALLDKLAIPLTYVALPAAWAGGCRFWEISVFLLLSPSAIVAALGSLPASAWLGHIWATMSVALIGYGLTIAISIPLAIILTSSRYLSRTMFPLLVVVQSTSIVAIAPIIVVVLGASEVPRIVIAFLISFFPIVVSTVTGLNSAAKID